MKSKGLKSVLAVIAAAAMAVSALPVSVFAETDGTVLPTTSELVTEEIQNASADKYKMRGLTAFQITSDMGAGWNLGNSFEAQGGETNWGNPRTTKEMIDKIAAEGFTTLRIPVRWDEVYTDASKHTISQKYFERISEVVNYGLDNGMYVIINVHHNAIQTQVSSNSATQEAVKKELSDIWTQIAAYFAAYGDKLIFETINEPRCGEDWTGNDTYYNCVNAYNEAARAAIRATGGNNAKRLVMMPTYCASADEAKLGGWKKLTNDAMVAASVHAYLPFDFAFSGKGHKDWKSSDEAEVKSLFERIDRHFISKGIPVVMGEFGAQNKQNTSDREKWATKYIEFARQSAAQDIPCILWDNNVFGYGNYDVEYFGYFNRAGRSFGDYKTIVDNIINGYKGEPKYEVSTTGQEVFFAGSSECQAWGQAVTMEPAVVANLGDNEELVVEWTGTKLPQIVLQGPDSDSAVAWVQIEATRYDVHKAFFMGKNIKAAYKYENYKGLRNVFVGAREAAVKITKVYVERGTAHTHNYNGTTSTVLKSSAYTMGRQKVCCSESGCKAYRVKLIPAGGSVSDDSVPTKPSGVTVTPGDKSLTVKWNAVNGATKYFVYTYLNGQYTLVRSNFTGTSYTITGLTNGTKYGVLVRAFNDANVGSAFTTNDLVLGTPAAAGVAKPSGVTVTPGDKSLTVKWNAVNGATKYFVYTYLNGQYTLVRSNFTGTSYTITGLTNGTKYGVLVRAFNDANVGSAFTTNDLVLGTPAAAGVAKPSGVTVTPGDKSLTVKWNAVNGATKYFVYTYLNGQYTLVRSNFTGTSYTITGLTNGTKYGVLVRAFNDANVGSAFTTNDLVVGTPAAAGVAKPSGVTVTPGDKSITVKWNAVNGATKYFVYTYVNGQYTLRRSNYTGTSFTVTGLTNGTRYGILVRAFNDANVGSAFTTADLVYATPKA